jgi:hypothetical protein
MKLKDVVAVNLLRFNKKINFFFLYLSFLFLLSCFYLSAVYLSRTNNSLAEWVINYSGGFVRRGLVGEIISQISIYLKMPLRDIFLIFQMLIYFIYYLLIYWLFHSLKKNYLIYLAIFSPVFFSFGLYELEALGRKEVLMYIFFILNFYFYYKFKNINFIYVFSYLSLTLLLLSHESIIFYFLFYIFFFFILDKKKNLRYYLLNLFLLFVVFSISLIIFLNPQSKENNLIMCNFLLTTHQEICNFPASFITSNISRHINEVSWKINHIITYFFIFIFGFGSIFLMIFKSQFTSFKSILNLTPSKVLLCCSLPGLLLFLVAVDSGRWTSMLYHMIAIFYFGMLRVQEIKVIYKFKIINFENIKYNFFSILILILLCFSWSPKAVYHEGVGTLPAYRMVQKIKHFIHNFSDPKNLFNRLFLNMKNI